CGEHSHVVASGALDTAFAVVKATKYIPAAYDDDNLNTEIANFSNLLCHVMNGFGRNCISAFVAERFATEFQQDPAIFGLRSFFHEFNVAGGTRRWRQQSQQGLPKYKQSLE